MNVVLLAALFLVPVAAEAAPVVWMHVPDGATQRIDAADTALVTERGRVETAEHAIVDTQGERQELKARRRDAGAERLKARAELRDAQRELHAAYRSGDEDETARRTRHYIDAQARLDRAQKHIGWHRSLLALNHAELRVDRAVRARAAADLEFAQSVLMYRHGYRFVYGPSSFEKQVARMDRKVEARESGVAIARSVASDTRSEYTASND